jgi:AraC family transcriptional regulator
MRQTADCYHGRAAESRRVAGLTLSLITYAPRLELPRHAHESAGFCLVLQGTYAEKYAGKTLSCRPQTVTFSPAGERHSNLFDGGGSHCFIMDMEPRWLAGLCEGGPRLDSPAEFAGGSLAWLATRLYREFCESDEASRLAIEGLALEMIAETARSSSRPRAHDAPRWLRQAKEILHAQFAERLSLAGLSSAVGVHPVYLASEFRRCYGSTIGEYLRRLRIEYACREIRASASPLTEIALSAGFSSQSHFSRTFKRHTGMTPAEYRSTSTAP